MRRVFALLFALTVSAADGNWISLFDGKTLSGWRGYRGPVADVWVVRDGALTVNRNGEPGTPGKGNTTLLSERQFANFELEFEWRNAVGGNSGVFYRVTEEEDRPQWTAIEYQLLDRGAHPDGKNGPDRWSAAAYALYPPAKEVAPRTPGEWNRSRIVAKGNQLEHYLNGVLACRFTIGSEDWKARVAKSKFSSWPKFGVPAMGHIALQDHGHFTAFRAMRIRELP